MKSDPGGRLEAAPRVRSEASATTRGWNEFGLHLGCLAGLALVWGSAIAGALHLLVVSAGQVRGSL